MGRPREEVDIYQVEFLRIVLDLLGARLLLFSKSVGQLYIGGWKKKELIPVQVTARYPTPSLTRKFRLSSSTILMMVRCL